MASVIKHKGKALGSMGVTIDGRLMLFPEEILYLLLNHKLRLLDHHGQQVTINTFLVKASDCLPERNVVPVYLFLKDRDFTVRRFGVPPRLSNERTAPGPNTLGWDAQIRFSVYDPSVVSRTKLPDKPLFHVVPMCANTAPSPLELAYTSFAAKDYTVLIAVVDADGNVVLFRFQ